MDAIRQLNNPAVPSIEEFEQWLQPLVEEYDATPDFAKDNSVLQIPVVVHVLHNGEPVGTAPNITDAQVISQIQVLNEDFRKIMGTRGHNTDPLGADLRIEFVLALTDPDGKATNGIVRRNINQDGVTIDELEGGIKQGTIWDATEYMNMWSVKFVEPDEGILGYAQFPEGSGLGGLPASGENAETDGVVMRYQSFGSSDLDDGSFILEAPYDLGRTGTHEVGHWIGLRHIWGDVLGCSLGVPLAGCSCTQDDYCDDTPNSDMANYGCPTDKTSPCGEDLMDPLLEDMVENYMDYTDDACMNIFTEDQKSRARTVMANSPRRMELPDSPGLLPPLPYVSFTSASTSVTEGSSCNYRDIEIELSIAQAPTGNVMVSMSTEGTVDADDLELLDPVIIFPSGTSTSRTATVRLYEDAIDEDLEQLTIRITNISGGNGVAAPYAQSHCLFIADDDYSPQVGGLQPNFTLFSEDFAGGIPAQWTVKATEGSSVTWLGGSPLNGMSQSAYVGQPDLPLSPYSYLPFTTESQCQLISPVIDASMATQLELSFDYICFGEQDLLSGDLFDYGSVWISCDGGSSWSAIGTPLVNQLTSTSVTIALPSCTGGTSELQVAFHWENDALIGFDPPFSIDNVRIEGFTRAPSLVEQDVNDDHPTEHTFGPNDEVHYYDTETGRLVLSLRNLSNYDFGCTSVAIDRSRTSSNANAVPFWNNNPENNLLAKTFRLYPEHSTPPNGTMVTATLYYTQAEILAWEFSTGQSRSHLTAVTVAGNAVSAVNTSNAGDFTVEVPATVVSTFNTSNVTLQFSLDASLDLGIGAGVVGQVLPVSLVAFDATPNAQGEVKLHWITETEENNDHFIIQRSADGKQFDAIGQVDGVGYSMVRRQYELTDRSPVAGRNYYRLVQVDYDGTTDHSWITQATIDGFEPTVHYFPNPVRDQLTVQFEAGEEISRQVRLLDALGTPVRTLNAESTTTLQLPVTGLAPGTYFLEVIEPNDRKLYPVGVFR